MPTTTFPVTTPAGFDAEITDISMGADSATDTAYTIVLDNSITQDSTQTLTFPSGSSLTIDGPGALTVPSGDVFDITTASGGTMGTLTLDTPVSGDAYIGPSPATATIVLNGAALINGSSAQSHSGANQLLNGTVLGQTATDSVDNFGQIEVSTSTTSTAVYMVGGTVTNETTGTIQGGTAGIVFQTTGTIDNSGTIVGANAGYGAYFEAGGTVVNGPGSASAASIQGVTDGVLFTQAGSVTNDAAITGTGTASSGVVMASGTVNNGLNNASSADIKGGEYGVQVSSGSAVVTNLGSITATDTDGQAPTNSQIVGISLAAGGTVYNGLTSSFVANPNAVTSGADYGVLIQGTAGTVYNSGTISGTVAVSFSTAGTILDNGAITSTAGTGGTAVQFGSGASAFELGSNYTITGKVEGATGSGNTATLELTNGINGSNNTVETFSGVNAGSGSLANGTASSFSFDNITTLAVDAGAEASFSGTNSVTNLQLGAGTTAKADIAASGSLTVTGTATGTGEITFGTNAALVIDTASGFGTGQGTANYAGDVIAQFAVGDSIDVKNVAFSTLATSFSSNNNQLQIGDGTNTADLDFTTGQFTALSAFNFANDGQGGTLVTVACYCPGTLIATPDGDMAVEALAIGDLVLTADGRAEPVRWIGRRSYAGRFVMAHPKVQPIRFRAGSLGGGLPRRDLLVSPEHAMFLDGVLVPARCLVDGVNIVREQGRDLVEYIHIELQEHEIILAEGAASETFIDDDSRGMFHNAAEYAAIYPNARPAAGFCATRLEDGYALEAIRQRLALETRFAAAA